MNSPARDDTFAAGAGARGRPGRPGGVPRPPADKRSILNDQTFIGAAPLPSTGSLYGATRADAGTGGRAASRGDFEVVHVIGEGGMGTVSLAQDARTEGRWVAVKRLSDQVAGDPHLLDRFRREAKLIGQLVHFHIVRVYETGEDRDGPFIVMEYVAGPSGSPDGLGSDHLPPPPLTLAAQVMDRGVYDIAQVVQLGLKLCSAVGHAHQRGVIHRDIKPKNILIDRDGEPKLADFGLARRIDAPEDENTRVGTPLGTLDYGASEQWTDATQVDERADLYALGATLWFALTGQRPGLFRESEVVPSLRPVLTRALQKDRERRFRTVAEFEEALKKLERRTTAAPDEADGLSRCVCPRCQHEHVLAPEDLAGLNFCEKCGDSLNEPCLRCRTENKAWSKFCRSCGADVAAEVQAARTLLAAHAELVAVLLSEFRIEDAIALLMDDGAVDHPRLEALAQKARQRLPRVEAALADAGRRRDQTLQEAQERLSAGDAAGAALLLQSIPAPLWNIEAELLLADVGSRMARVDQLHREIDEQLALRSFDGLSAHVHQLLELQPRDEKALALLPRIQEYEVRRERNTCKAALQQGTIEGYRHYLRDFPSGRRADRASDELAHLLRDQLLRQPADIPLRREYLSVRTDALGRLDEDRAFLGILESYSICGAVGGSFVGGVGGGFGGGTVGLIGGAIGGVIVAVATLKSGGGFRKAILSIVQRIVFMGIQYVLITIAIIALACLVSIFWKLFTPTGMLIGGAFGSILGAGVGGLVGMIGDEARTKARFGPLPSIQYASTVAVLDLKYLDRP